MAAPTAGIFVGVARRLSRRLFFTASAGAPSVSASSACEVSEPLALAEEETKASLSSRVESLAAGDSASVAIRAWMGEGRAVHRGNVFHAINRLRRLRLHRRALEIMEWIVQERPYKLSELDYSYLLEFTCRIHGIANGEKLFLCVPPQFQKELLYNNLVMACLDKGAIKLAYSYMRKMRKLSFMISPFIYNRLIILNASPARRRAIPKILTDMKADGVPPHTSTYNILLKINASEHDIDGVGKVFNDMRIARVEPNEITYGILAIAYAVARLYTAAEMYTEEIVKSRTGNNWSTSDILLILYGYLGKKIELERTWNSVLELHHVPHKCFMLAIEAFGRVGSVDDAEEIWRAMKSNLQEPKTEHFNSIISVFCRHGIADKAAKVFREMIESGCKPNAITYHNLALGCLKSGLVKEALETIEKGKIEKVTEKLCKSIPWLETTYMLLEMFSELGDLENSKRMFDELNKTKFCRYTFVYNTYLRAFVKAKVYDPELLERMIVGGARPDSETYSLLRLIEQFKVC